MKKRDFCKVLIAAPIVGCRTIQDGESNIVVRSEQTLDISFAVLDNFLRFVDASSSELPVNVLLVADAIKRNAPVALRSANNLRRRYKDNLTPENRANLLTAICVVEQLVEGSKVWLPMIALSTVYEPKAFVVTERLIAEAQASKSTKSFASLFPVIVDLAQTIYQAVLLIQNSRAQKAAWDSAKEDAFQAQLDSLNTLPHWLVQE